MPDAEPVTMAVLPETEKDMAGLVEGQRFGFAA
jgi:hypothetical protein